MKGPSNSLRDIRVPNWYKCKWVLLVCTEGVSLKALAAFEWAEWQRTCRRISPTNLLIAPRNWWLLIVRWLTWSSNYVGPRGRLMFQHVILSQSVAALCLWIWRQMAYCQQRRGFVFHRAEGGKKSAPGELAFCFSLINKMLIVCNYLQHYTLNRDVKWLWHCCGPVCVQDEHAKFDSLAGLTVFVFKEIISLINLTFIWINMTHKKATCSLFYV